MRSTVLTLLAVALFTLTGCGEKPVTLDEFHSRPITLPGGEKIRVEVMIHPTDMARGMMFRDSLAPDRGMLFINGQPGKYRYFMYQVNIPLDMIWMDSNRRIVEIAADAPPCKSKNSKECPVYGGNVDAQYILELAGGMAKKYRLKPGDVLTF